MTYNWVEHERRWRIYRDGLEGGGKRQRRREGLIWLRHSKPDASSHSKPSCTGSRRPCCARPGSPAMGGGGYVPAARGATPPPRGRANQGVTPMPHDRPDAPATRWGAQIRRWIVGSTQIRWWIAKFWERGGGGGACKFLSRAADRVSTVRRVAKLYSSSAMKYYLL